MLFRSGRLPVSRRGWRTSRGAGKRLFHSKHFGFQTTQVVPNGTVFGAPAINDTFVVSMQSMSSQQGALFKDIRVARIIWSSVLTCATPVAAVTAYARCDECLYQDGITSAGAAAHAGTVFLQTNELLSTSLGRSYPERIVWKRLSYQQLGQSNGSTPGMPTAGIEQNPAVLKPRLKLDDDEGLVYRVEFTNPTTSSVTFAIGVVATLVLETRL